VRLQRVVMPGSEAVSWTVIADSGEPVAPIEAYLSFLCAIERSPNTVRHYAVGLKLFFEFLDSAGVAWREAGVDDVARFVAWLRAPDPDVIGETLGRQPAGWWALIPVASSPLEPAPKRTRGGRVKV
jgi:hypothetical protein